MKKRHAYAMTADCVVFGWDNIKLHVALIGRKQEPFLGQWALPGGFMEENETLEETAVRELKEETNISTVYLEQCGVFSNPDRDPRMRVITTAFVALTHLDTHTLEASHDAAQVRWFPVEEIPKLAFDHEKIFGCAHRQLQRSMYFGPIGFHLLGELFTLTDLQLLSEAILGQELDKRNFRKKISGYPFIQGTNQQRRGQKQRPAQLYRFDRKQFERWRQERSTDLLKHW